MPTSAAQVTRHSRDSRAAGSQTAGAAPILADVMPARLDIRPKVYDVEVAGKPHNRVAQQAIQVEAFESGVCTRMTNTLAGGV